MSDDLKPCPFCGGKAELQKVLIGDSYIIQCVGRTTPLCADLPSPIISGKNVAITAWNTRPAEDALMAELEQVERECGAKRDMLAERTAEWKKAKAQVRELVEAIRAAMRIRDLWAAIPDCAPEHDGEMEALCMMEAEFKSVLAKHAEEEK